MSNEIDLVRESLAKKHTVFSTELGGDKGVSKFLLGVMNTLTANPKLLECNPDSIRDVAITSACLGVPIDARHYAYIVPYKGKAQFQLSYKGYIHIAKRDKDVDTIASTLVYSGDAFTFDIGANTISHIPDLDHETYGTQDGVKFAYAKVTFRGGTGRAPIFEVMTKKQLSEIRESSKAGGKSDKWGNPTIWEKHEGEMMRKTVIKRLCKHAQLGDVAIYDQIDNAVENNQIINVTPDGVLLVEDEDEKLKAKIVDAVEKCETPEELAGVVGKYNENLQDLYLCNIAVSKVIGKAITTKTDQLYMDSVVEYMDACEDSDSLDKVYNAHKVRIDQLKAANRNALTEVYVNKQQRFLDEPFKELQPM